MNKVLILLLLVGVFTISNAQMHGGGYYDPDSLEVLTIEGTAIVDSNFVQPMYYLDSDGDGEADYHLNFGPYWYEPDEGNAVRPNDGDVVTLKGGLHEFDSGIDVIVVYEINGEFWYEPFDPFWNDFGQHMHDGGHHGDDCSGYAFGFDHDSLTTVQLNGRTLVDSTFVMNHYYLDVDNDELPDYFLNFGPPWFEPESGAVRPNNGEDIQIVGGQVGENDVPMIFVYEINGLTWRDSSNVGFHFGSGWIHRDMSDSSIFHAPSDGLDWMIINPGWHHGGMPSGDMMSDSLFCQLLEIYPHNVPNTLGENVFAAYEIGIFRPDGTNNMWNNGSCGGHMNFNSNMEFNLHFSDLQLLGFDPNTINAKYWDDQSSAWISITNQTVNLTEGTVSFETDNVSNFIVLTSDRITGLSGAEYATAIPEQFRLLQNYPNPFNPATIIKFELNEPSHVRLGVFNVLGENVSTLVNDNFTAGSYGFNFNANDLPTGIYFYELVANNFKQTKKMLLIK